MPKMKTNKSAAKRFRVKGRGVKCRIKRGRSNGNHNLSTQTRRARRQRKLAMHVVSNTLMRVVKRLLCLKRG